jgi:predicted nucleic acid-binding protein
VEAKQRGLIKNVKDAITGMRNGGYRIHNDIVDFALRKAGEDQ